MHILVIRFTYLHTSYYHFIDAEGKGLKVNKFCDSEEFQDGELEEKEDDELGIIEMGESYI